MHKYVCSICGYVYDEAAGIPSAGITPGTRWEDLPADWVCPLCGAAKSAFKRQGTPAPAPAPKGPAPATHAAEGPLRSGELSALFSNLAKGCEKQYLPELAAQFGQLADYYQQKAAPEKSARLEALQTLLAADLDSAYPEAHAAAGAAADRGAKRALVWSEKVTRMLQSLLNRYQQEGAGFLAHTNVYVCEICGFIYVGDAPPEICPVCKVPRLKIALQQRR